MARTVVKEITRADLLNLDKPDSGSITDVKQLSSYTWTQSFINPTIVVPGCPPVWCPPQHPLELQEDDGLVFIDLDAASHPQNPMEPLFRALYTSNSSFNIRHVDVVTDLYNILNLLSFVNPRLWRKVPMPFTMNIEIIKSTTVFAPAGSYAGETALSGPLKGFTNSFRDAYTSPQINGSIGHRRIISYRLGNLSMIVRHKTSTYADRFMLRYPSYAQVRDPANRPYSFEKTSTGLKVQKQGWPVSLSSTIEVKTSVAGEPIDIKDLMPQLWASQTPKLVRAVSINGMSFPPAVEDVSIDVKEWEKQCQEDLKTLNALTTKITEIVKEFKGYAILKYDIRKDKLIIQKAETKMMLPKDLYPQ